MAQVVGSNQVKTNDGKIISAQQGGWYDGQQFWDGTLSQPGQINVKSNQVGAGQAVSKEVIAQTNPQNVSYIDQQRKQAGLTPSPSVNNPSSGLPTGSGSLGGGGGFSTPETLNLPKLYESLYGSSGISELEKDLAEKERIFTETKGKINDNPYLSEGTRVGRVAKLEQLHAERTANQRNEIATKKADIETKLNLETKQFDINSQASQQALSQFNTLLGMGALDGASGEDIANITRSTGLSSQAIYSAIDANKKKNAQTQVITSTNDAGVVTAVVLDTQTGQVISKTSLGSIGNAQNGPSNKATENEMAQYYSGALREDAAKGLKLSKIFELYTGYLDPNTIYTLYNASSKYGPDTGSVENLRKYGVTLKGPNDTGDPYGG